MFNTRGSFDMKRSGIIRNTIFSIGSMVYGKTE